jgi:hypothetical protein
VETVFTLDHIYETSDGREEVKRIGIYSSREKAEGAIERLKVQSGFADHSDGFHISEVKLNRDGWVEGVSRVIIEP